MVEKECFEIISDKVAVNISGSETKYHHGLTLHRISTADSYSWSVRKYKDSRPTARRGLDGNGATLAVQDEGEFWKIAIPGELIVEDKFSFEFEYEHPVFKQTVFAIPCLLDVSSYQVIFQHSRECKELSLTIEINGRVVDGSRALLRNLGWNPNENAFIGVTHVPHTPYVAHATVFNWKMRGALIAITLWFATIIVSEFAAFLIKKLWV